MSLIDTLSEHNDSSMTGEDNNMREEGDEYDSMSEGDNLRSAAHWYNPSVSYRFALIFCFLSVSF